VGNYEAMLSFELVKKILGHAGVSLDRLALDWASASEAPVFVDLITAFTRRIKELGPLGQAEGLDKDELRLKLSAAREAVKSVKLRMRFGKLAGEMRQENDYSPEAIEAKIEERAHEAILKEMDKQESALRTQGA